MKAIGRTAAVALVACLTAGAWVAAQTRPATTLTAADYSEVTELYHRMYHASDSRNRDGWVSTFADDGVFRLPNGMEVVGKQALVDWRTKSFGGKTGDTRKRHWVSGLVMTPNADGSAKVRAYWLALDVSKTPGTVIETGTFDDVVVKTPGGWKFKRHAVIFDSAE